MPSHAFVEIEDLSNFARYVCAFREHPLRVYHHELNEKKVLSCRHLLTNTILSFFTYTEKSGRYVSYNVTSGKESWDIVNSTKTISNYAPIVSLGKLPPPFNAETKNIEDKFVPVEIAELGSLARLTYDPENPDEPELSLLLFPHKNKWIIGYITLIDMDDVLYCFNYVKLDEQPQKPFLKYSGHDDKKPEFANTFQHGYPYFPIIRLKNSHPIFGLK